MKKQIPVTILTWFLGAGKTTLLNNILDNKKWYKIAVIENEYGEESIDSELIRQDVTELIEIKDGCMCCVVRWDLIKWVQKLLDSRDDLDYIIIEASGMSEPMPVAQTFMMENFDGKTKLDSIVWVVDAQNFHDKITQSLQTTVEQIESSHFIILNKVEGVDEETLTQIKTTIRTINKYAAIIDSDYCKVDIDAVLDTHLFAEDSIPWDRHDDHEDHNHHHDHDHDYHNHHGEVSHEHSNDKQQMEKYFFKTDIPCFHLENIKHFLAEISENIFRMRGFICFKDYPNERYILQKAGSCFTLEKDENWHGTSTASKMVCIWKDINKQALQDQLLNTVFFT